MIAQTVSRDRSHHRVCPVPKDIYQPFGTAPQERLPPHPAYGAGEIGFEATFCFAGKRCTMKKIVLFSDGTGNSAASPHKTNVWRAYQALDRSPGRNQIAFYDNGVGTSSFTPTALLGLAFGVGLARNVKQIYGFLCRTYEDGDEIYGFGFSRGAFTMRVAVALIASQGIIDRKVAKNDRDLDRLVATAYRNFRQKSFSPSLLSFFLRPVRDQLFRVWNTVLGRAPYDPGKNLRYEEEDAEPTTLIKFLGVWDTVDAYGLPIDEFTRAWDKVVWPLTADDRNLSRRVERACQALAIDEQRQSFEPMLWNEEGAAGGPTIDDEKLSQVWFPGVHADVGGGYPDDALASVSLNWILDQSAKNDGLIYIAHERQRYSDSAHSHGPMHDSRRGIGNLYRYAPRNLERLCAEAKPGLANWLKGILNKLSMVTLDVNKNEMEIAKPKIHHSVFERLKQSGDAYAPINIPKTYALVDATGAVIDVEATGSVARLLPEDADAARNRRTRQSYVWNKVWARRVLYILTLAAILSFVTFPYWPGSITDKGLKSIAGWLDPLLGAFGVVIRAIPSLVGKIPGLSIAETWAMKFDEFPFIFSIGILIIGLLFIASWKVNAALKDEMRANWHHVTGRGNPPPTSVGALRVFFARILESQTYADWVRRPVRIGLEAMAITVFLLILVAVCSRLVFGAADGIGIFCASVPKVPELMPGETFEFTFDPADPCLATGRRVTRGGKYRIELDITENWTDDFWFSGTLDANLNGLASPPFYAYLLIPIRRHLFSGWYQPIARLDNELFARYALENRKAEQNEDQENKYRTLEMDFIAQRSGQLYVYVNDTVLFTPTFVKSFYGRNTGMARGTVTALPPEQQAAQE